jgi:sialate O-acetylesterase
MRQFISHLENSFCSLSEPLSTIWLRYKTHNLTHEGDFVIRLWTMVLVAVMAAALSSVAQADVQPHPLFSDHMVLQRSVPHNVWGTADAGEEVTVTLMTSDGTSKTAKTSADKKGQWLVQLPALKPGTENTLKIQGKNTITLNDVAIGDVWVCSGQSNMEWRLNQLGKDNQGRMVADKATNPKIRLFTVPNRPSAKPETTFPVTDREGTWLECKPDTVFNFSAVGYFFGREIQKTQDVPVGLIASDWGGTSAQSWTSREALQREPSLAYYVTQFDAALKNYDEEKVEANYQAALKQWDEAVAKAKAENKPAPPQPRKPGNPGSGPTTTTLFNGMIAPIVKFPITGVIWYQGESNAGKAYEYRTLMPTLIKDWRNRWNKEIPFFQVQLAPFRGGASGVDYAELRDAQYNTTKVLPKTGIAIITDVGDETDIHPQQKQPVGERLALAARAVVYGEKVEYQGPTFKDIKTMGSKLVLTFENTAGGLVAKDDELTGFQVAGEDKVFHPAKAEIDGDKVIVSSEEVNNPIAVRYGWVNFAKPTLNFFNKAGLPASPFRTDSFPLTTAPKD